MHIILTALLVIMTATVGHSKMVTKTVPYQHNGTEFEGYLVYDDAVAGKRPGVLVVHEWWGLNDFVKNRAQKVAELGYVALAVDMYGKGKVTQDPDEARHLASHVRSTPLMRERAQAGLKILAKHERVDPRKLAAMGFCFGGTTVLELAYSGADLRGVASFHGGLSIPRPGEGSQIKASILVLHGADDPMIKAEEIAAFQGAMREAKADWQMVLFGGAVHSFTNPGASDLSRGVAYHALTAARSFKYLEIFLKEIFSR